MLKAEKLFRGGRQAEQCPGVELAYLGMHQVPSRFKIQRNDLSSDTAVSEIYVPFFGRHRKNYGDLYQRHRLHPYNLIALALKYNLNSCPRPLLAF